MPTYPYWDSANRYIVSPQQYAVGGLSKKPVVFAQIFQLPNSWWQVRCYGSRSQCPEKLGPFFGPLSAAQAAIQTHCETVHFVTPPPALAIATAQPLDAHATSALDPTTPSKIIPRF